MGNDKWKGNDNLKGQFRRLFLCSPNRSIGLRSLRFKCLCGCALNSMTNWYVLIERMTKWSTGLLNCELSVSG